MAQYVRDEDPDDPRVFLPNVEFYITNVCNLTCFNCNRFNNHNFTGWQRWSDFEPLYQQWSSKIRLQKITILGGEPLLNPSILDWVDGINRLWDKPVQILSNGSQLNRVPNLYDRLLAFTNTKSGSKNWIGVSLHNANDRDRCFEEIKKFLKGKVQYVHHTDPRNKDNAWTYGGQHAFYDSNGMRICVWEYDDFYTAAVIKNSDGEYTLHNSDPAKAYAVCGFAQFDCFHFVRGKIYRCGPVALFPEFDQQHRLAINDEDRTLINSYRPLTVSDVESHGKAFFSQDYPLDQCKFCPQSFTMTKIQAVTKKQGSTSAYD